MPAQLAAGPVRARCPTRGSGRVRRRSGLLLGVVERRQWRRLIGGRSAQPNSRSASTGVAGQDRPVQIGADDSPDHAPSVRSPCPVADTTDHAGQRPGPRAESGHRRRGSRSRSARAAGCRRPSSGTRRWPRPSPPQRPAGRCPSGWTTSRRPESLVGSAVGCRGTTCPSNWKPAHTPNTTAPLPTAWARVPSSARASVDRTSGRPRRPDAVDVRRGQRSSDWGLDELGVDPRHEARRARTSPLPPSP